MSTHQTPSATAPTQHNPGPTTPTEPFQPPSELDSAAQSAQAAQGEVVTADEKQAVIDASLKTRSTGVKRMRDEAQLGPESDPFYDNSQEESHATSQEPRAGPIDFDESQQSLPVLGPDAESQRELDENDADVPAGESQPGFGVEENPSVFD